MIKQTDCAYCTGLPFIDYGPNGIERGLCRKHAQELAVDYGQVVALLKIGYRHLVQAMEYAESESRFSKRRKSLNLLADADDFDERGR